jgi:hypothetical protein
MKMLYHASANQSLGVIEPQQTLSKDKYIGDYVFATADKVLATMYLIPKGYGSIMHPEENPPRIQICADETEIRSKDNDGALYYLDASSFDESPQTELSEYEMASDKAVRPISKEVFRSSFDALDKMGIKIEFIDQQTFNRLAKIT